MKSFLKKLKQFANLNFKQVPQIRYKKPTNAIEQKKLQDLVEFKKLTFLNKESRQAFEKCYSPEVFKNLICSDKTEPKHLK